MRIESNLLAALAVGALAAAGSQGRGAPARRWVPGEGSARAARRLEQRRAELKSYYRDASFPDDSRQVVRRIELKAAKARARREGIDWRALRAEVRAEWRELSPDNPSRRNAPTAAGKRAARTPSPRPVRAAQSGAGQ